MAIRFSTGLRNGLCGSLGFKDMLNGGHIKIYSGAQPASADYAETGSLLVTITSSSGSNGINMGTAATGVLPKESGTWSGVIAAAGVAGWFRFYGTGGTTGTSATEKRIDGNIGVTGSDMTLANTTLVAGATLTIDSCNITQPAQ